MGRLNVQFQCLKSANMALSNRTSPDETGSSGLPMASVAALASAAALAVGILVWRVVASQVTG